MIEKDIDAFAKRSNPAAVNNLMRTETMDTIYRGYTIRLNADGSYEVHSRGSYPVIAETFPTEDDAMVRIDQERRKQLRQN